MATYLPTENVTGTQLSNLQAKGIGLRSLFNEGAIDGEGQSTAKQALDSYAQAAP
jgi:hypothetical protein